MIYKALIIAILFIMQNALTQIHVKGQTIGLFAVSDLAQVFEDGYNLPDEHNSIEIFGIRNEIISGQCVLHSKKSLKNVKVELRLLKNTHTGYTIPEDNITWNFIGSIPLSENAPNQLENILVRNN